MSAPRRPDVPAHPARPADVPDPLALARIIEALDQHADRLADARYGLHALGAAQTAEETAGHALSVLALSHALAERALRTRWCFVTDALTYGATVEQVAAAMGAYWTPGEVSAGLSAWATEQEQVHARYGSLGLSPAEAAEVRALVAGPEHRAVSS